MRRSFAGQAAVSKGQVREYTFDSFAAEIDASKTAISARNLTATRGRTTAAGSIALGAQSGSFTNPTIAGQLTLRNLDVAEIAREGGFNRPVTGTATATARITGTLENPEATIALDVQNPSGAGEKADRLRANVRYEPGSLDLSDGILNDGPSEIRFNATYKHPPANLRSGNLTFEASTQNLPMVRLESVALLEPKISGVLNGRVQGAEPSIQPAIPSP